MEFSDRELPRAGKSNYPVCITESWRSIVLLKMRLWVIDDSKTQTPTFFAKKTCVITHSLNSQQYLVGWKWGAFGLMRMTFLYPLLFEEWNDVGRVNGCCAARLIRRGFRHEDSLGNRAFADQFNRGTRRANSFFLRYDWRNCCDWLSAQSRSGGGARLCPMDQPQQCQNIEAHQIFPASRVGVAAATDSAARDTVALQALPIAVLRSCCIP